MSNATALAIGSRLVQFFDLNSMAVNTSPEEDSSAPYVNPHQTLSNHSLLYAHNMSFSETVRQMHNISHIYIGFMTIFGLIGNCLCILMFMCSSLRYRSPTQYLIAMSFFDSGFLFTVLLTWLKRFGIGFYSSSLACKLTNFLAYLCR